MLGATKQDSFSRDEYSFLVQSGQVQRGQFQTDFGKDGDDVKVSIVKRVWVQRSDVNWDGFETFKAKIAA